MSAPGQWSRTVALTALLALGAAMALWLLDQATFQSGPGRWIAIALGLAPPVALLLSAIRSPTRWGEWTALFMVPYFCIGVMDLIAATESIWNGLILATLALVIFFAALDSARRSRQ